ncbi:MAG: DUF421 domain-containing protein [Syntrophomonadaceae bacterium]
MSIWLIISRSIIAFLALLLLTSLMGKRQIGQFSFFNYAAGITLGSIAAAISVDEALTVGEGLSVLAIWGLLAIGLAYLVIYFRAGRKLLMGAPSIVIRNGRIEQQALARLRLNLDDLGMLLRREKIFDITDVEYAIFETDGQLSVLKKPELNNVTRRDLDIPAPALKYLPAELIVDGRVIEKNLKEVNLNRGWLEEHVKAQGYKSADDIFYGELLSDGSVFLNPRHRSR